VGYIHRRLDLRDYILARSKYCVAFHRVLILSAVISYLILYKLSILVDVGSLKIGHFVIAMIVQAHKEMVMCSSPLVRIYGHGTVNPWVS
jgi:hypothetical protein